MQNRFYYLFNDVGISAFSPTKELAYVPILLHQTISFKYGSASDEVQSAEIDNPILYNNLTFVDSKMCELIKSIALISCADEIISPTKLIQELEVKNPLNFDLRFGHPFYEQKIRHFLLSLIVEISNNKLQPNWRYNTLFSIKSSDGIELCFAVYNRNAFETFLLQHISFVSKIKKNDSRIFSIDMNFEFKCDHDITLRY